MESFFDLMYGYKSFYRYLDCIFGKWLYGKNQKKHQDIVE